jgi:predicted CXXCH cytochrome family protein
MRKYDPQARVDQLDEYLTSVHGERMEEGDLNVATCTDCHGVHGTRGVNDPNSAVYPTNVASTCGRCHADEELISPYGIPSDQAELYTASVHGETLIKERDISAPTCNDCHGNHGATPPGVDSVANVCGQCHVSQWDLFDQSPHKDAFADFGFPACVTCHEHHAVARTSDEMLGVEESATCVMCHDEGSTGYAAAAEMKSRIVRLQGLLEGARQVLERAERAGMEVSGPIYDLSEGRDRLVRARVVTHRFDTAALNEVLQEGETIASKAEQGGWEALDDLAFRRKGLAVSAVILLCMIGLLVAKIRQVSA